MGHFVVAYVRQPEVSLKEAVAVVLKALADEEWDGKLTVRGRDGNPWIQVEGFWPQEMADVGRALTRGGLDAVGVEEESVSGCMSYSRFRKGKFVFRFSKCEDQREIKGKPLDWEQAMFSKVGDDAVYSLSPIAKHLGLPGFDGERAGYWQAEKAYRGA
jgi:hypothetical protein